MLILKRNVKLHFFKKNILCHRDMTSGSQAVTQPPLSLNVDA